MIVSKRRLDELVELRPEKWGGPKDPARPYVGLEHLAQGSPQLLGCLPSNESVSINCLFEKDDILFGKLRPNLRKSVRAPFAGYCSTDILVLRAREGIHPAFAGHVFQWKDVFNAAVATAAGTKMPRTSWNELRRFCVVCPHSKIEQERLSRIVNAIDAAIERTAAMIAKLKQVRVGLLHDLVTRGLDENGDLRDPSRHPKQFQESSLGKIPKNWRVVTVGELVSQNRQGILTGPFGVQLGTNDFVAMGVPVLQVGNVQAGYIDLSDAKFVTEKKASLLSRYRVQPGDLLFARSGATTGRNSLAGPEVTGAIINYHIIRIAVNPSMCDSRFMYACFNSAWLSGQVHSAKGKGTREGINTAALSGFTLPCPRVEEQSACADRLDHLDASIRAALADQAKLTQLKSGLMSDLLTGRVPVPGSIDAEVFT